MPTIITLLTDFGTRDTYVGQMKGVILGLAPTAQVVDLTHEVGPQDVMGGAVLLDGAVDAFEPSAIHVAVVDPGVGSERRPVTVRTERGTFIGPDNGLFTAVLRRWHMLEAVVLSNDQYHRRPVSPTFHGRDIFAAAAGHLANGTPLANLGDAIHSLVQLDLPSPRHVAGGMELHVLAQDHFGNLITDLEHVHLASFDPRQVRIQVGEVTIHGLSRTFADVQPGQPLAYLGSSGRLEIAVRDGSAQATLGVGRGATILLRNGGPDQSTATPGLARPRQREQQG